jgi:MSHA biogenesis protein MshM
LCRRFLATLGEDHVVAYLPNPMLEPRILLIAIAEELGLKLQGSDFQFHLLKEFNQHLLDMAAQGKKVVICIDEAQSMPLESLEALRLLSNLETEKRKLLQVVMFGQPELDQKLADPAVRQLRQRIVFHYRMPGLKQQEAAHYLAHRLRVAGHREWGRLSAGQRAPAVPLVQRYAAPGQRAGAQSHAAGLRRRQDQDKSCPCNACGARYGRLATAALVARVVT